jgi:DNA-binding transcriptional MerR regulator
MRTPMPTYTIRDLAEEFDITTRTLRFYEEKGMLSPRRQGQLRIYNAGDRTRLKLILRGKRLGLDLQESSEIIAMYNPGTNNQQQLKALLAKIEEKKTQLVRQQEDLDAMFEDLKLWEKNCNEALSNA